MRPVMALYEDAWSSVSATGGTSVLFEISVELQKGSTLSPLLCNLVREVATKQCRKGVPWDILYADDLILSAETKEKVLESKGLRVNLSKTKILV